MADGLTGHGLRPGGVVDPPSSDVVRAAPHPVIAQPSHLGRPGLRRVVVAYHAVGPWDSELVVSEQVLRAQVGYFLERGFVGMTVSESERRLLNGTLPARTVAFTFDDGFRGVLDAKAILDEAKYPATMFLVTGFAGGRRPLDWYGLRNVVGNMPESERRSITWDEAANLASSGWEIGSHTVTHPLLSGARPAQLSRELEESRQEIASVVGRCESVAYPYGVPDRYVAEAARRAGYSSGWILTSAHLVDKPMLRPRLGLASADVGLRLRAKVSTLGVRLRRSSMVAAALQASGRNRSRIPPE